MFFRLAAAIGLTTAIGLMLIAIEKQNLMLKQAISVQHYQLDLLREQHCRLLLKSQRLSAPSRLVEDWHHQRR